MYHGKCMLHPISIVSATADATLKTSLETPISDHETIR